ncbi:MAG: AAA family ATPase [Actinomycetota bacterium]|nr:AAA family ATPase [Actinomycetota bacterium]MDQ3647688.1 AAA family ATPase [Actinomycetota bacterium]
MKLAIAGKGGAGKTSITGTLARIVARRGRRVLAIDNDLNPNLSLTLGIPAARMSGLPTFPAEIVHRNEDGVYELAMSLAEICDTSSVPTPDGVSLLVAAQPRGGTGCQGAVHMAVRGVIDAAPRGEEDVCIVDLEASTEHLLVATAKHADAMYAVVEPYGTSLETGRRVAALARHLGLPRVGLIANKVRDEHDVASVAAYAERHRIELAGAVPYDECFHEAERLARAPLDHDPDTPAVRAIGDLAARVVTDGAPRAADSLASPLPAGC